MNDMTIDYACHCKFDFREYVKNHEQQNNIITERVMGALALRPTRKNQGGYDFLSLLTSQSLNCLHSTEFPIPE